MANTMTYEQILNSKIINARPSTLARKLKISPITASWFKNKVKEKHQEIVKNEVAHLTTDIIADKLGIPLELAAWLKEELCKEI